MPVRLHPKTSNVFHIDKYKNLSIALFYFDSSGGIIGYQ